MRFFPPFLGKLSSWLLIAGYTVAIYAVPHTSAQTPQSEGNDSYASDHRCPAWLIASDGVADTLQNIIIPTAEFRQTTLTNAIKFLRRQSHLPDPDLDADTQEIKIFLKPPASKECPAEIIPGLPRPTDPADLAASLITPTDVADPNTPVTLTLTQVPLLEALKAVALQANLKVEIGEHAVYFVRKTCSILFLTIAAYRVSPELLGLSSDTSVRYPGETSSGESNEFSVVIRRLDRTSWFASKGVSFPPGAEAVYLLSTNKLIARNTQENLDKINAILSSAQKALKLSPANP